MKTAIQEQKPEFVIYGHAGFDVCVTMGSTVKVPGGAAYYAAVGASLFTESAGVVTVIGHDFPRSYFETLSIDTSGVVVSAGRSAMFYQEYSADGKVVKFRGQLNVCEHLSPNLVPQSYDYASIFLIATMPPLQQQCILRWLSSKERKPLVAIDTTGEYVSQFAVLLKEHANCIDFVFANAEEYRVLGDISPRISLVIKRGPAGASLRAHGEWLNVAAPRVDEVRDTTGAGDVLAGAFLAKIALAADCESALAAAVGVATRSVSKPGVEHLRHSGYTLS